MKLHLNSLVAALTAAILTGHTGLAEELRFPAAPAAARPGAALTTDSSLFLVGDPGAIRTTPSNGSPGAVHVHEAGTGTPLRRLVSPDIANGDQFGSALALSGNLAVIGAPGSKPTILLSRVNGAVGAAYVMDVSSGAVVFRLGPTIKVGVGTAGQSFGASVGICGNLALVGAPAEQSGRGAVYVFDMQQRGQIVRRIVLPNAAAGDRFGSTLSTAGSLVLVGAPGKVLSSGTTGKGAAYVVDVNTGAVVQLLESRSLNDIGRPVLVPGVTASSFGTSVAMAGELAVVEETQEVNGQPVQALVHVHRIRNGLKLAKLAADGPRAIPALSGSLLAVGGAQAGTTGSVAFYNALNGERLSSLTTSDAQAGDGFGRSLAFHGSTLLVGTSVEGTRAAVYQFTSLAGPLPGRVVTHTGAQAPLIANATIDLMGDFHINSDGEAQIKCSLTGIGMTNSRNRALLHELRPKPLTEASRARNLELSLVIQKGETLNGFRVESLDDKTTFQNRELGIVAASLSGGTLGTNPQQALVTDNGTTLNILKKLGDPASRNNPNIVINSFEEVGSSQLFPRLAVKIRNRSTLARIDSALLMINALTGEIVAETHESSALPSSMGQGVMGEVTGRPIISAANVIFAAPYTFIVGRNTFQNRGIFRLTPSQGLQNIVFDGMTAQGASPEVFRSFDMVSADNTDKVAFRAFLNGNADRNECIVIAEGSRLRMVARKGAAVPGLSGSTFRSFEQLWPAASGHVTFLAEINNPQPNPPRTRALCLARPNGTLEILVRQGELAPGTTNGERISQIETLEGNTDAGTYAVIATITGGQQVLLAGDVTRPYAKPAMLLRQGSLVTRNGQTTQVSSMRMTVTAPVGCGGGSAITKSQVAVFVSLFDTIPHACVISF